MREIKFRVWDILSKKIKKDIDLWDIKYGEIFPHTPDQRCFEIMQYTGLKDKKGVEIYEGDICKVDNIENFEVIWRGIGFCFKGNDEKCLYLLLLIIGLKLLATFTKT